MLDEEQETLILMMNDVTIVLLLAAINSIGETQHNHSVIPLYLAK
jgi:hypothetical protein